MGTGVTITANKKAKQNHERVFLSQMTAISWKTATFVLPCLIVWHLWNPQGPVTQHSFCFITRTKPWLTLFQIVCFRYNESNYSSCIENTEYQKKVSNITRNDTILQQITDKSSTNNRILFFFSQSSAHPSCMMHWFFLGCWYMTRFQELSADRVLPLVKVVCANSKRTNKKHVVSQLMSKNPWKILQKEESFSVQTHLLIRCIQI